MRTIDTLDDVALELIFRASHDLRGDDSETIFGSEPEPEQVRHVAAGLTLSRVCRRWSTLARAYSYLWSTIYFGWGDRVALALMQLDRSRHHHLAVTLQWMPENQSDSESESGAESLNMCVLERLSDRESKLQAESLHVWRAIRAHASRIHELSVDIYDDYLDIGDVFNSIFFSSPIAMPVLRFLAVSFDSYSVRPIVPPVCPPLRTLLLTSAQPSDVWRLCGPNMDLLALRDLNLGTAEVQRIVNVLRDVRSLRFDRIALHGDAEEQTSTFRDLRIGCLTLRNMDRQHSTVIRNMLPDNLGAAVAAMEIYRSSGHSDTKNADPVADLQLLDLRTFEATTRLEFLYNRIRFIGPDDDSYRQWDLDGGDIFASDLSGVFAAAPAFLDTLTHIQGRPSWCAEILTMASRHRAVLPNLSVLHLPVSSDDLSRHAVAVSPVSCADLQLRFPALRLVALTVDAEHGALNITQASLTLPFIEWLAQVSPPGARFKWENWDWATNIENDIPERIVATTADGICEQLRSTIAASV